jgi:hypothetical protein
MGFPSLFFRNLIGFAFILGGGLLGGLYFRWRASSWPVAPSIRYKRFTFATLAAGIPAAFAMLPMERGPRVLFAVVGLSLSLGILVSGDRRADV